MKNINIDTQRIRECGKDIIDLSKELNEIITVLFNHISTLNNETGEWKGNSANQFISNANIDKLQYLKIKDSIYQSGKYLTNYADFMEKVISEVRH